MKPGDSVLAPRNVPHVWAYIGEQPGRMIIAFSPAAKIESYFEETSKPGAKPNDPKRYEAHGMKLLGPPSWGRCAPRLRMPDALAPCGIDNIDQESRQAWSPDIVPVGFDGMWYACQKTRRCCFDST